ncbi:polysaccharide lyase family 7 protein [Marinoscillum furvescens]|uniref:Putative repeat protein (TIGR02543 family)/predicted secreted protein (Por secretion system target) n=1 Tax=Marinoscillum furvescens DSM 4134 TaxID=1122208 RepID=A0A3D9L5P1_MARFU|nr:polysaccharide lyase family 7 protein [Marinoscillum furvescens]REE00134.1 putative repeat protein (TIGR02543 family)/predicted secreted protein (Por secretion system target) [Marinoscillum furvescens DSM 4134]
MKNNPTTIRSTVSRKSWHYLSSLFFGLTLLICCSFISQAQTYNAPYDIPRFQDFIGECKLQAPTSSTEATNSELKAGYTSSWFYVVNGDKVAFNQSGSKQRTELRDLRNWDLTQADQSLFGKIDIVQQTCDQVTVMQIHDDANAGSGPNKPLLRIYKHNAKSPTNHIWAAIKTDNGGSNTTHIDLGADPGGYFTCHVKLENGRMIIDYEGVEKVNMDVSFWDFPSYWKAGVYLQDDGEATAHFDELHTGTPSSPSDYTLTTSTVGNGTISLNPGGGTYSPGTTVSLTANPASGYQFDHWSGDASGTSATTSVVMDANKSVTAHFVSTGGSIQISYDDFENGWGSFSDGGSDASRYTGGNYAYGGDAAINIQDNSSSSVMTYTNSVDISSYSSLTVDFAFYPRSMENGEDFWLQLYDGSSYTTVGSWARGTDFQNNNFYTVSVTVDPSIVNFASNMKVRFRCDASGNADDVYIDNVEVTANGSGSRTSGSSIEWMGRLETESLEPQALSINAFPNPFAEQLNIQIAGENTKPALLRIYSMDGKLAYSKSITPSQDGVNITTDHLKSGMYLIHLQQGVKKASFRILKQ